MSPSQQLPLPLEGRLSDSGERFTLTEPFHFIEGDLEVRVPVGFDSDYNSVPRVFWRVFPPWQFPAAGVVHDYLYRYNGVTRAQADGVHRRILELVGCPPWLAWTAYGVLRITGWRAWNRYRDGVLD
jgi:hypothetical protein